MNIKALDTPESFYKSIPRTLDENIQFRMDLSKLCDGDAFARKTVLNLCIAEPKIFFNALAWTVNPRKPPGERNWPFILREPKQEAVVDLLKSCIDNQHDMGINKSRDEGATELVCKFFCLYSLIPDSYFLVGSRNKELVDAVGDPYTLMAKIRYCFDTLPNWVGRFKMYEAKDMQITVPDTNVVIRGETTNESFSAGRRATAMLLDEFGRVEPRVAESIEGSVHDVTGCVIYGSTHWYGEHHPFNKALKKSSTRVVSLLWYQNPEKNGGLYVTPDYDIVELRDRDYYLTKYPDIAWPEGEFKLSEFERSLLGYDGPTPKFIADGGDNFQQSTLRSPWHDVEEEKRKGNARDFISNVWASPLGSQDSVFSPVVLAQIENEHLKLPNKTGQILYDTSISGKVRRVKFSESKDKLHWWGDPPTKSHNYVIGCDISLGTGNSNSVAAILDVNTGSVVGLWVDAKTPPEEFADVVRALAIWCGGKAGEAFVIFENNGGHATNFARRLKVQGQTRIYTQRTEDAKTKRVQNKLGWRSNPNTKSDMLGELGVALSEGLKKSPNFHFIRIHDHDVLSELRGYVYYENGDIGASEEQDQTTGARKRHGDRVIAVGLACLGKKYQAKARPVETKVPAWDSFEARKRRVAAERAHNEKHYRQFRWT